MEEKKVAILQSNYIPWKGYFDIINSVDEFIIFDDVQYTRRDWRNRNLIKTPNGLKWLTIPVNVKGQFEIPINRVEIANDDWRESHWDIIKNSYKTCEFFHETQNIFSSLYNNLSEQLLSKVNYQFISTINSILDIETKISFSTDYRLDEGKNQRLISLCLQCNASTYLSGPAAKNYIDEKEFSKNGIKIEWMDYYGYPEYNQLFSPFVHGVTILDLIFNAGKSARKYLKSFNKK